MLLKYEKNLKRPLFIVSHLPLNKVSVSVADFKNKTVLINILYQHIKQ